MADQRGTENFFKFYLFTFVRAGSSLLCRLFSSCGDGGYSLVGVRRLLIAVASLVEHGFWST